MVEETQGQKEEKEETFFGKVAKLGYPSFVNGAHFVDLGNPDKGYQSYGIVDANGRPLMWMTFPTEEMELLAELVRRKSGTGKK